VPDYSSDFSAEVLCSTQMRRALFVVETDAILTVKIALAGAGALCGWVIARMGAPALCADLL
jgi:hypothetical protein